MSNVFVAFQALIPTEPLMVGTIDSSEDGAVIVTLDDGRQVKARGDFSVGARVFVRGEAIQGTAPSLPTMDLEV